MATTSEAPPPPAAPAQVPLTEAMEKSVKSMVAQYLYHDEATLLRESVADIQEMFPPQFHSAVVTEILNNSFEKFVFAIVSSVFYIYPQVQGL